MFNYKTIQKDNNGSLIMLVGEQEQVFVPAQPMSDVDYSSFTL